MTLRERLLEYGLDEILMADGFDEAFLGVARRAGQTPLAVYDVDKCLDVLVAQGLSPEEAIEHFEFNVVGAWVGPGTPLFLDPLTSTT